METTLAHDMHGAPLHYVDEIIVREGQTRVGFKYRCGFIGKDGKRYSVLTRTRPVSA